MTKSIYNKIFKYNDVEKRERFPHNLFFVEEIYLSPVDSSYKQQVMQSFC